MNAEQISTKHARLIAGIATALTGKAEAGAASTEAGQSVSAALREYAKATVDDPVSEARKALGVNLHFSEVKAGTIKGSLNHFTGFRAMLDDGLNIDDKGEGKPYTNADAQAYIASDDVKRLKSLRSAIGEVVKTAAKKWDGEKTNREAEDRLKAIAQQVGADISEYRAMLDQLGREEEGQEEGAASAAA